MDSMIISISLPFVLSVQLQVRPTPYSPYTCFTSLLERRDIASATSPSRISTSTSLADPGDGMSRTMYHVRGAITSDLRNIYPSRLDHAEKFEETLYRSLVMRL